MVCKKEKCRRVFYSYKSAIEYEGNFLKMAEAVLTKSSFTKQGVCIFERCCLPPGLFEVIGE